jgi:hypothetical protein
MLAPFNLQQWIDDNRDLLKPPVSNKNPYKEAYYWFKGELLDLKGL